MGVNETASKLANEIKNSSEYRLFKKHMNEIKKDKKAEELLRNYKVLQLEVQSYSMTNRDANAKTVNKLKVIESKVKENKKIHNYLKSEYNFNLMMANINKILAQAVEKDYK